MSENLRDMTVESIRSRKLRELPEDGGRIRIFAELEHEIIFNSRDKRRATAIIEATVKGENDYVFETLITLRLDFLYDDEADIAKVEESLAESLDRVGSKVSFLNGLLTNELLDAPLIIPPRFARKDSE